MLTVRAIIAGALCCASCPLTASRLVLADRDGRPLLIETTDIGTLEPAEQDAKAIVDEFARLCLPDPGGAFSRVQSSVFGMEAVELTLPTTGKIPEAQIPVRRGYSAMLSVWKGDDIALSKRPISIESRAYVVSGQYGAFRAVGEQCNFTVKVRDFEASNQIVDALNARFGSSGKLVVKKTWADGYWLIPGSKVRLNFTTPSTDEGARPVYLSAQIIEKEGK